MQIMARDDNFHSVFALTVNGRINGNIVIIALAFNKSVAEPVSCSVIICEHIHCGKLIFILVK